MSVYSRTLLVFTVLPTDGWPGRVDMGIWLCIWMVYPFTDGHPFQLCPRVTMLISRVIEIEGWSFEFCFSFWHNISRAYFSYICFQNDL